MLIHRKSQGWARRARQQGVVLMVALIVLVAMTLAGIALMRSVDTTTIIAGNLAFQQAATNSADIGVEAAVTWLESNNSGTTLQADIPAQGFFASVSNPGTTQSWDAYWTSVLVPSTPGVVTLATSATTGNTVAYAIQRLCNAPGDPASGVDCAQAQTTSASGSSSKGAGVVALLYNSSIYYRITTRVAGPRNTVSYTQTIVSL